MKLIQKLSRNILLGKMKDIKSGSKYDLKLSLSQINLLIWLKVCIFV